MSHSLTRKELYSLVWSKPAEDVAVEYGLSGRGLGKLCERHSIPVPPRGYWQRKKAGQKVQRPPLIMLPDQSSEAPILKRRLQDATVVPEQVQKDELPEEIVEAIKAEANPVNVITVSKTLHSPHPIIAKWIAAEKRQREHYKEQRYSASWGYFHKPEKITALETRRRLLLSALLKALEVRGFKVACEERPQKLTASIDRDQISFDIFEHFRQYRRALTEEERKDRFGGMKNQKWTQVKEPTGQLRLHVSNGWVKADIKETDDLMLESQLNNVVVEIIKAVWDVKKTRLKREHEDHLRWEAVRKRDELEKRRKAEQKRRQDLIQQAKDWKDAELICQYVAAMKSAAKQQVSGREFSEWEAWALQVASDLSASGGFENEDDSEDDEC